MSGIIIEESGRSGNTSRDGNRAMKRKYKLTGAADEPAAWNALYDYLVDQIADPPDLAGLAWWEIQVEESVRGVWSGIASWKRFQRQTGEAQFNFEIGVENTRIVVPVAPIGVYKAAGEPNLSLQLIGDRADGKEPEGIDIPVPVHEESETHWVAAADVSAFKVSAKQLVGRVNDATWKGHAAGEVLLRGVSGARRGLGDWEMTFRWGVRENQTGIVIGNVTGINKQGWQYLWPISKLRGTVPVKQITHVGVATVFRSGDMTTLGIS